MTNKEFLERLKNIDMIYKTDENGNVSEIISCGETYENHFKQLEKDLEDLEELKKIMGTPIQEIMKRLKILEIIKRVIFLTNNSYYIQTKKRLNDEDYKLIKEYLDGKD